MADQTLSVGIVEGSVVVQLGDVGWAAMNAAGAAKVGRQPMTLSCELRGLTGPLFVIEPDE